MKNITSAGMMKIKIPWEDEGGGPETVLVDEGVGVGEGEGVGGDVAGGNGGGTTIEKLG